MAGALNVLLIVCLLQGALCREFNIIIPQSVEFLTGSCVTIPCFFDFPQEYDPNFSSACKAIWKSGNMEVFNSAGPTRKNGELIGNLTKKDCTTTLHNMGRDNSNTYQFRIECADRLKYSYQPKSTVSLRADPPSPTLSPSTPTLEVKEGSSVNLTCSAWTPCWSHPPTLTWTSGLGGVHETLQEKQNKTKVQTSVLTFTASYLHHGKKISCTAAYRNSTKSATSKSLTLSISFAPQILSSGCNNTAVHPICSCETVGNPSPTLQWYLNGSPVNGSGNLRSFITVDQPRQRELSTLICHSSNSLGTSTQRFYIYSFGLKNSAKSQECSCPVTFATFIITVGVLTAALISALLFAIIAQKTGCHNATNSPCTGDTSRAVMGQSLTSEKRHEALITSEEDIYANSCIIRTVETPHLGNQQVANKRKEESGDLIYSSVIWKSKGKKEQCSEDRNPTGSSYLEEERCMAGGRSRNVVSNTAEMTCLYDTIMTGKDAKRAAS